MAKTMNLIEMSKSFKLKSGKISNDLIALSDLKEKLFLYFKRLVNTSKTQCPGTRCNSAQTTKSYFINNYPSYLMFNLSSENSNICSSISCSMDLLKCFILIPRLFELSSLFENTYKNKIFFEFVGAIGIKNNNTFITVFKHNDGNSRFWLYYEDEFVTNVGSYYDLISFCLKNSIVLMALLYQAIEDKYSDNDVEIGFEEMGNLERYAAGLDTANESTSNRLRPLEETIKESATGSVGNSDKNEDSTSSSTKKFKRNTSNINSTKPPSQPSSMSNNLSCNQNLVINPNSSSQLDHNIITGNTHEMRYSELELQQSSEILNLNMDKHLAQRVVACGVCGIKSFKSVEASPYCMTCSNKLKIDIETPTLTPSNFIVDSRDSKITPKDNNSHILKQLGDREKILKPINPANMYYDPSKDHEESNSQFNPHPKIMTPQSKSNKPNEINEGINYNMQNPTSVLQNKSNSKSDTLNPRKSNDISILPRDKSAESMIIDEKSKFY